MNMVEKLYPSRKTVKLRDYDYSSPGAYFVTICTHERQCLFGDILGDEISLNGYGRIVKTCWEEVQQHYPSVKLNVFIIMPNHVHGIIEITEGTRAGLRPASTDNPSLFEIVRAFKTFSARRVNKVRNLTGQPVWQRGYYEHIIRSEEEHQKIGDYIYGNPVNWGKDSDNPINIKNR